eukprot:TRINITY_DN2853_c0_g1_i2.p3 TRINITY_DN2853_c0_g1~~TRINITY_DN2853_c0_g1_i2.p3  ORF type:complete len:121 (+),score=1.02 TRINITY_DN2853_c0_g1_i2:342-704(+)
MYLVFMQNVVFWDNKSGKQQQENNAMFLMPFRYQEYIFDKSMFLKEYCFSYVIKPTKFKFFVIFQQKMRQMAESNGIGVGTNFIYLLFIECKLNLKFKLIRWQLLLTFAFEVSVGGGCSL